MGGALLFMDQETDPVFNRLAVFSRSRFEPKGHIHIAADGVWGYFTGNGRPNHGRPWEWTCTTRATLTLFLRRFSRQQCIMTLLITKGDVPDFPQYLDDHKTYVFNVPSEAKPEAYFSPQFRGASDKKGELEAILLATDYIQAFIGEVETKPGAPLGYEADG